jgi:hypothetical protein
MEYGVKDVGWNGIPEGKGKKISNTSKTTFAQSLLAPKEIASFLRTFPFAYLFLSAFETWKESRDAILSKPEVSRA